MCNTPMLPTYKSNATVEQRAQKLSLIYFQTSMIKEQETKGVPVSKTIIRCGCSKKIKLLYAYRCLYCGVWYCKSCAEKHFGMLVAKYT